MLEQQPLDEWRSVEQKETKCQKPPIEMCLVAKLNSNYQLRISAQQTPLEKFLTLNQILFRIRGNKWCDKGTACFVRVKSQDIKREMARTWQTLVSPPSAVGGQCQGGALQTFFSVTGFGFLDDKCIPQTNRKLTSQECEIPFSVFDGPSLPISRDCFESILCKYEKIFVT